MHYKSIYVYGIHGYTEKLTGKQMKIIINLCIMCDLKLLKNVF